MGKSVRQRILDSFQGDESAVQAKEFGERVYAAWKDISVSLSRSALLVFLLIAAFELLVYQRMPGTISVGTFTLENVPTVQIVLPAVVAFVIYDGFRLSVRWLRLGRAYRALMSIYAPQQLDNGLEFLIFPNLPSLWGLGGSTGFRIVVTTADKFMNQVNAIVSYTAMFVVPVIFECQAYYRLVQKFGYQNVLVWISAGITAVLGAFSLVYVWLETFVD
jgi:hypothetical protein